VRRAAIVAVLVVVVAGCGGSGESGESEAEKQVRAAVTEFYAALERGDGRAACALLSETGREDAEAANPKAGRCEVELVAEHGGTPPPRITSIEIKGDTAEVGLRNGEGGSTVLTKEPDGWKLDAY
jgi:hypothetical protein